MKLSKNGGKIFVDTYKNLKSLSVKVVSPPIAIPFGLEPAIPNELSNNPFSIQNTSQIMFRGRIQGDNFISTHQLLEDPCNPTKFVGDDRSLSQLINAHMLCISKIDTHTATPRVGDIVTVDATIGQSGPLDVQFCYFNSIEQALSNEACPTGSILIFES